MDIIKAKVKVGTCKYHVEGSLDSAIGTLFMVISDSARREAILKKLNIINERLKNSSEVES